MKKFQFGLKLWSINENYIEEAVRLYNDGVYSYIELYAVPGSYEKYISIWKNINIPYIVHAPHFRDGMNLAKREKSESNKKLIKEAQQFADSLSAKWIIFHPGISGDIKETASQLKEIGDKRVLIENKPYYALGDGLICNGTTPEEISFIIKSAEVGFCMDVGHAICSANAKKIDFISFLRKFIDLKPELFHLTDGDINGIYDRHDHFGKGTFPIGEILNLVPSNAMITVETIKDSNSILHDYALDLDKLKEMGVKSYGY